MLDRPKRFDFEPVANWGEIGNGGPIRFVSGIAVDAQDRVFTFARDTAPVTVFDRDGRVLARWGEGVFTRAHGLTIGPDGNVYCADDKDHTISSFTWNGAKLRTWGSRNQPTDTGYDGTLASAKRSAGPFNRPTNLAFAPDGTMFVSDGYGNARIHRFDPTGELTLSWGEPGTGPGQFRVPHSVEVDPRGRVVVADRENHRLQFFTLNGEFLEQWPLASRPEEVDFDGEGNLHVAEGTGKVSIFDLDGNLLKEIGGKGMDLSGVRVPKAHSMAVDSQGNIYIASQNFETNGFVIKLRRLP